MGLWDDIVDWFFDKKGKVAIVKELNSDYFCRKNISSRSKYTAIETRKCHRKKGHRGNCDEFPFLNNLKKTHPRIAQKIIRDSIMTTGAAWKSEEAGPNRILRWVMLLSDKELLEYDIDMSNLKPQVIAKIREKSADYDSCIKVSVSLAKKVYEMPGAPQLDDYTREYLEDVSGSIDISSTKCTICLLPLQFDWFASARRGKALIETCHKDPRLHTPENVGFAHRECNIAQGPKTLDEFYEWIEGIIKRTR